MSLRSSNTPLAQHYPPHPTVAMCLAFDDGVAGSFLDHYVLTFCRLRYAKSRNAT